MPELPEVETTRRGIASRLEGRRLTGAVVRDARLRWPVPADLEAVVRGRRLHAVRRRAKYLLLELDRGTLILHLGMSGSLRILPAVTPPQAHDHLDLLFGRDCLRLRDPRRFGSLHWVSGEAAQHPLLHRLGPEPLSEQFDGDYLFTRSRGRSTPVKAFLMDQKVVVGVGNIYANEALFLAGIHPARRCSRISRARYRTLARTVKRVLSDAIQRGGTTLRDFQRDDGRPGYFAQALHVYGRAGAACPQCGSLIRQRRIGQRSSFYCPRCQR